jgi:hypothetical protein
MLWKERHGDELYVFYNGVLIFKKWLKPKFGKSYSHVFHKGA